MSPRRKIRDKRDLRFIRITYAATPNIYETAKALGMPVRYVREVLVNEKRFTPARDIRMKVLQMHRAGWQDSQIARKLRITVNWVRKILNRHLTLDRLADIEIIPHPPFPDTDTFELEPEHRQRLEKLREAKVKKYYDDQNRDRESDH